MGDVEEYRKRLEGSASGGNTEDYYKLARDQEYNLLLNKEVALENAKSNAMKYTQNQINAQGFGGTGYGSSMQSGIYNNYMNKANEAYADYGEGIKNINMQENEAKLAEANDRFQSVTTMLQGADSVESMNKLLTDYGYGSMDKNGNFSWNEAKPEGMSDDDWYQMKYYYGMQKNAFDQEANSSNQAVLNFGASQYMYTDGDGKNYRTVNKGDDFEQELYATQMGISTGSIPDGSYIHLQTKEGKHMFLKYENGRVVYVNKSDYDSADANNCYYCYGRDEMKNEKK